MQSPPLERVNGVSSALHWRLERSCQPHVVVRRRGSVRPAAACAVPVLRSLVLLRSRALLAVCTVCSSRVVVPAPLRQPPFARPAMRAPLPSLLLALLSISATLGSARVLDVTADLSDVRDTLSNTSFEYIVVGGGNGPSPSRPRPAGSRLTPSLHTAGLAVAARISQSSPSRKVLVLEAGQSGAGNPGVDIPGLAGALMSLSKHFPVLIHSSQRYDARYGSRLVLLHHASGAGRHSLDLLAARYALLRLALFGLQSSRVLIACARREGPRRLVGYQLPRLDPPERRRAGRLGESRRLFGLVRRNPECVRIVISLERL